MRKSHSPRAVLARSAGIVAIAAAAILSTTTAFAAPLAAPPIQVGTPNKPVLLDRPMSGELANGMQGHYAFYMFKYPGANKLVTINLQVTPDDSAILDLAGFKVYGPTKDKIYAQGGVRKGLVPNISGDMKTEESGNFIIQVYNSHPSSPITYTLSLDGVPMLPASASPTAAETVIAAPVVTAPAVVPTATPAPTVTAPGATFPVVPYAPSIPSATTPPVVVAAPPVPAPVAAPATVASPTPAASPTKDNSFKGRLDRGTSGHFATFEFNYPGDESVYTINLNMSPDDARIAEVAGFRVYGPQKDKIYTKGGYRNKLMPNVSGDLISKDPGTYVVQVYNYSPDTFVDYEVSLVPNPPAKR